MQTELLWILLCVGPGVGFLLEISLLLRELIRTMKRIEARLTLLNPLESEAQALQGDYLLKGTLRDRATQYDIWFHQHAQELRGLTGENYRDTRKLQKHTERTARN